MRTDSSSLSFFRQLMVKVLSARADRPPCRLAAEAIVVRDADGLVCTRYSAGCIREMIRSAAGEAAEIGWKTRAGLPVHQPRAPPPGVSLDAQRTRRPPATASEVAVPAAIHGGEKVAEAQTSQLNDELSVRIRVVL